MILGILIALSINSQSQNITKYQYWFDNDFINAVTKSVNSPSYELKADIDVSALKNGMHSFNLRFMDTQQKWSVISSESFFKAGNGSSKINLITEYQYWWGDDIKNTRVVKLQNPSSALNIMAEYNLTDIPKDVWRLNYIFKDTTGLWSSVLNSVLIPIADFTPIVQPGINKLNVNFTNKTVLANSYIWKFGDSYTSTQVSPAHIYAAPGEYDVSLIAWNPLASDTAFAHITLKGIDKVFPAIGGNTGDVTVNCYGGGFKTGTKFFFRANGQADIFGDTTRFQSPGNLMSIFDLRGKQTGLYDVIVQVPGETEWVLKDAFTIQTGIPADPWVDIVGRDRILFNNWQPYTINYGNNGNVNASGVVLWIAIPDETGSDIRFDDIKIEQSKYVIDHNLKASIDTMPIFFKTDKLFGEDFKVKVYPLYIPSIPAGKSLTAQISIKTAQNTSVVAWTNLPYFQSPFNAELAQCMISVLGEGVVDIGTSAIPGVGCLVSVGKQVYNPWDSYRPQENNTWGSWLWNAAVTVVDCGVNLSGAGAIVKGIGVFAANMSGYAKTFKECQDAFKDNCRKRRNIKAVSSFDPNEKIGPVGYNVNKYTKKAVKYPYTVLFENKKSASAPAHKVAIIDTLDITKYNTKEFGFGPITFGNKTITPLSGLDEFTEDIDMRPGINIIARINAKLDTHTGIITWDFLSLDPITMGITDDPDLGFLPPNVNPPEGEGSVSYTVGLMPDLKHNDKLVNKATIVFDANAPIITNEYMNTIDNIKPLSQVLPLNATITDEAFTVSWTGSDDGSGILNYSVFVLVNDTGNVVWKKNTTETSAVFNGKIGYNYKFYSQATDSVGNVEDAHTSYDTQTSLKMSVDEFDSHERDKISITPNPFSDYANIEYQLFSKSDVTISLYTIYGAKVSDLLEENKPAGTYHYLINSINLKSGVYLLEFRTNNSLVTNKIIVN